MSTDTKIKKVAVKCNERVMAFLRKQGVTNLDFKSESDEVHKEWGVYALYPSQEVSFNFPKHVLGHFDKKVPRPYKLVSYAEFKEVVIAAEKEANNP